jgi:hypothetical protein
MRTERDKQYVQVADCMAQDALPINLPAWLPLQAKPAGHGNAIL